MARKDDLKLLFNFMIELLKEEDTKPAEEKHLPKYQTTTDDTPKKLILDGKQEESAKHILEVMKRAELMDKMRSTVISRPKVVPPSLRDVDEADNEAIITHEIENRGKSATEIKTVLSEAKEMINDLETKRPIVQSVPPAYLNEIETKKGKNTRKRK